MSNRKVKTQTGEVFIKDGHLRYELEMLMFAFHQIPNYSQQWVNVKLELFLLHARNLLDFLRKGKKGIAYQATKYQLEIDNLNCQDFVKKYYIVICIQLSHPSDERKQGYNWMEALPEIYNGIISNYTKLFSIHNINIENLENAIKNISIKPRVNEGESSGIISLIQPVDGLSQTFIDDFKNKKIGR